MPHTPASTADHTTHDLHLSAVTATSSLREYTEDSPELDTLLNNLARNAHLDVQADDILDDH